MLSTHLRSDSRHRENSMSIADLQHGTVGHLRMMGGTGRVPRRRQCCGRHDRFLPQVGIDAQTLDWFVPHQANCRIIDASAEKLGIAPERW